MKKIKSHIKSHIKKNDKVKVIVGKDAGKIGKVLKINRKTNRVIIENINIVHKHLKPGGTSRQGGIIDTEAPIPIGNIMLVCNKCITPVRIKFQKLDDGKKVRVCRKCNEFIDS